MLHIKKLDIFILKSYCLLFAGTFFICLFIFMMQFLWRYVDELVGKGLEFSVLLDFFFYSGLTLVPISLPLAVLLASLITFGNFGERYELLAMKAAGISLLNIIRPLVFFTVFISLVSFYFQNVIGPRAESKLWTLVISMRQKSPELDIPEKAFYDQIEGYNLYVGRKDRNTGMLYNVLIYDFQNGFDNATIIKSDSGKLEMVDDKQHMFLRLYSGEQFENLQEQNMSTQNVPYRREAFSQKHALIEFNADFNMVDEGFMSGQSSTKNMKALQASIDSMEVRVDSLSRENHVSIMNSVYTHPTAIGDRDSTVLNGSRDDEFSMDYVWMTSTLNQKQELLKQATQSIKTAQNDWDYKTLFLDQTRKNVSRHKTAWHEKITLALACLIFFFIGAPLGSIIRKGGLGMPVVISVIIFIFYYIINNTGYKMGRDGIWIPWTGMWLSTAVLAPVGVFLTYKANKDSSVLSRDAYVALVRRILMIPSVRNLTLKEVIIQDPDMDRVIPALGVLSQDCGRYIAQKRLKHLPNYLTLWTNLDRDAFLDSIEQRLEAYVEELSNSHSARIVGTLNRYPVLLNPSDLLLSCHRWVNIATGVVLPVGLLVYLRVWIARRRLVESLQRIISVTGEITYIAANKNFSS